MSSLTPRPTQPTAPEVCHCKPSINIDAVVERCPLAVNHRGRPQCRPTLCRTPTCRQYPRLHSNDSDNALMPLVSWHGVHMQWSKVHAKSSGPTRTLPLSMLCLCSSHGAAAAAATAVALGPIWRAPRQRLPRLLPLLNRGSRHQAASSCDPGARGRCPCCPPQLRIDLAQLEVVASKCAAPLRAFARLR